MELTSHKFATARMAREQLEHLKSLQNFGYALKIRFYSLKINHNLLYLRSVIHNKTMRERCLHLSSIVHSHRKRVKFFARSRLCLHFKKVSISLSVDEVIPNGIFTTPSSKAIWAISKILLVNTLMKNKETEVNEIV